MAKKKKTCLDCGKPISPRAKRCGKCKWNDPTYRQTCSEHLSPEAARERWRSPEYRQKQSTSRSIVLKRRWEDPEYRREMCELSEANWQNIEYRTVQETVRNTLEFRQNYVDAMLAKWQEPEYRQKQVKARAVTMKARWLRGDFDGVFKSPSSLEIQLAEALDVCGVIYAQQYRLEGDSRPFDFFIPPYLLVEVDGEYWHSFPDRIEKDRLKTELAKERGFTLVRVPERAFKELDPLNIVQEQILPLVNETDSLLELSSR